MTHPQYDCLRAWVKANDGIANRRMQRRHDPIPALPEITSRNEQSRVPVTCKELSGMQDGEVSFSGLCLEQGKQVMRWRYMGRDCGD